MERTERPSEAVCERRTLAGSASTGSGTTSGASAEFIVNVLTWPSDLGVRWLTESAFSVVLRDELEDFGFLVETISVFVA